MVKIIKAILIFLGGLITGVGVIVGAILKNETACKCLIQVIYEKIFGPARSSYRSFCHRAGTPYNCRVDEIIFDSKEKALYILRVLNRLIKDYGYAKVSEYYQLAGEDFTRRDTVYVWFSLEPAYVKHTRRGWVINLPNPCFLSRKEKSHEETH